MARHDLLLPADAELGAVETYAPLDALIRSGLRRAFPLPAEGEDNDEMFRLLLVALEQHHGRSRQPATFFAGNRS